MNVYIVDAEIKNARGINQAKRLVLETSALADSERYRTMALSAARAWFSQQSVTIIAIGVSEFQCVIGLADQ